jgi:hypothetical protein
VRSGAKVTSVLKVCTPLKWREMIEDQYMSEEETYEEEKQEEISKEEQLITLSSSTTGDTTKSLKYKS